MAGTASSQQPLLLTSYCIRGRLVYSVRLESVSDDEEPALEIRLSPDPIARFLDDTNFRAIAFSGGTILGLVHGSRDTGVLDIVTQASAPGPQLRDPKRRPVMLPVGADTVIVMGTLLRGGCCCFEALRRVPGGRWRADPLPNPPIALEDNPGLEEDGDDYVALLPVVGAYFALGTHVWISVNTRALGTYSLDTERGTWRKEGNWALPLQGRSLFVPEFNLVFGFSNSFDGCSHCLKPRCHHLYALDVEAQPPVVRHMWEFPVERKEEVPAGTNMVSLAHLGNGRFCIARPVKVERSAWLSPWCNGKGTSFAVVDVTRSPGPGGGVQLATRGWAHTHQWGRPYEQYGYADFL